MIPNPGERERLASEGPKPLPHYRAFDATKGHTKEQALAEARAAGFSYLRFNGLIYRVNPPNDAPGWPDSAPPIGTLPEPLRAEMAGPPAPFVVGDVVRLKSGGPMMCVDKVVEDTIYVEWFHDGENRSTTFLDACLERVIPEGERRAVFAPAVGWRLDKVRSHTFNTPTGTLTVVKDERGIVKEVTANGELLVGYPHPEESPLWQIDTRYCDHCKKDTQQNCRDSGHERDSSDEWQECLTCHWFKSGMSSEWRAPHITGV